MNNQTHPAASGEITQKEIDLEMRAYEAHILKKESEKDNIVKALNALEDKFSDDGDIEALCSVHRIKQRLGVTIYKGVWAE